MLWESVVIIKKIFLYLVTVERMIVLKAVLLNRSVKNCSVKKKVRSEKEFKALLNRLSRIEGQVRGVRSMLENDAYCIDILTQVSAINAALNSFNKVLISNHIRTCVKENIQAGNDEVIDELVVTLQKLMK